MYDFFKKGGIKFNVNFFINLIKDRETEYILKSLLNRDTELASRLIQLSRPGDIFSMAVLYNDAKLLGFLKEIGFRLSEHLDVDDITLYINSRKYKAIRYLIFNENIHPRNICHYACVNLDYFVLRKIVILNIATPIEACPHVKEQINKERGKFYKDKEKYIKTYNIIKQA
jgi:hypothetical protein